MAEKIVAYAARPASACDDGDCHPRKLTCRSGGGCIDNQLRTGSDGVALCLRVATVMALSLILLACAAVSAPHIGKTARSDNQFPLAGVSQGETTWSARDLKIHYKAVATGNNFEITGSVDFSPNLAKYPTITTFRIHLHFLDTNGIVIDSKTLWASPGQVDTRFVRWTFDKQWTLPPGTVAIGFSYRGGVAEGGGDSGGRTKTGWQVFQSP